MFITWVHTHYFLFLKKIPDQYKMSYLLLFRDDETEGCSAGYQVKTDTRYNLEVFEYLTETCQFSSLGCHP